MIDKKIHSAACRLSQPEPTRDGFDGGKTRALPSINGGLLPPSPQKKATPTVMWRWKVGGAY